MDKKIIAKLSILLFLLLAISCSSEVEAEKDVESLITKLTQFNEDFEDYYSDNAIDESEQERLYSTATDYYNIMNKINSKIKKEKEGVENGKPANGYEKLYQKAISENESTIMEEVTKFEQNMLILESL